MLRSLPQIPGFREWSRENNPVGLLPGPNCFRSAKWLDTNSNTGDVTHTGATYRVAHRCTCPCYGVRLVYAHSSCNENNSSWTNATVRAGVEDQSGNLYRVYFRGATTATIEPGGFVVSDPLPIIAVPGDKIFLRNYISVPGGVSKWGTQIHYENSVDLTDNYASAPGTDVTGSTGAIGAASFNNPYSAVAICGITVPAGIDFVGLYGDSICGGYADNFQGSQGYLGRALEAAGIPYQDCALLADTANNALSPVTHHLSRLMLLSSCTKIICEYGSNDIASGSWTNAQIQNNLNGIWTFLNKIAPVHQTTITPRSNSTDSWVTTGNQTPQTGWGPAAQASVINAYIRGNPSPLTDWHEIANVVETAQDSGIWKVASGPAALTSDGTHLNTAGCIVAQAGVITNKLRS